METSASFEARTAPRSYPTGIRGRVIARGDPAAEAGLPTTFVQGNVSFSTRGVLRGLHYQEPHPQGKLVYVLQGEVFDVAVDICRDSPKFGRWVGAVLSAENKRQLWMPPGFAHGFCVTSDTELFAYKCTDYYCPECEGAIFWNDPDIGIVWPVVRPTLSHRDRAAPHLRQPRAAGQMG